MTEQPRAAPEPPPEQAPPAAPAARLYGDADGGALAEATLRAITASTSRARGDDFLRLMVRELALALDVRYVIAGRLIRMADGHEGIRTLALWGGGDHLPAMEYSLRHTPCQDVTEQSICFHASGIQAGYPQDGLLVEMRAESYIGIPMIDTEGKTLGILSAIDTRPISEDKRLLALSLLSIFATRCAAELQHQEREHTLEQTVRQRSEALLAAQAILVEQEKMAALGALVAGVAHEVNTPIGVAVTASSSLSAHADELVKCVGGERVSRSQLVATAQRLREAALLIERNLARAADLIGNFKQLAVDQGSTHVVEMGLRDHALSVVSAHGPELRKVGIQVAVEIADDLRVRLDAGRWSQVLSNLLMNAAKHGYPNGGPGKVVLGGRAEAAEGARWLLVDFADDGVGLTADVRERLFEPFFTTKRGQGGSGLGMHIVYTIVHQMGGQVAVSPGAPGCRIHIRLPLAA
ncbi:Signal transduction histidine kinase [Duganella sp. CF517]|uniref:sensor histidine kinase n=1 Tax=Duganella sp. CF517 TaxID=1881038 RepID=UPI0008D08F1E|nr:HAMP domain-containing sensor histidine kinase [Duganella sp. CF517]SEN56088.1 Signal transduction histidine kinase [Duganella sp. CF517]